jgi:Tol biopolymer transport system component
MHRLLVLAFFVLVLAAGCGGGSDGGPTPIPLNDRLVVIRDTGIFELALATGDERPLLLDPPGALLADPAVSPDGTQIAHVRLLQPEIQQGVQADFGADLYVAGIDGSNPHLVYEHKVRGEQARGPRWTPDGTHLLFSVERFETDHFVTQIISLDLASGETAVLVENAVQPAVSPDGSSIGYAAIDDQGLQSLWLANADGSEPRLLFGPDQGQGIILSPRYSPDGTQIAVAASEVVPVGARHNDPAYASRGGGTEPLRRPPAYLYNGFPMDIWLVDTETGAASKLADIDADQPYVAWSGDSLRLFMIDATGLYAIDPATGNGSRLGQGTFHGQLDWLAAQ